MNYLDNYKHIIWDWNGTIFNDVELCVDVINNLITKHNLPQLTLDKYRDIFTFPVRDYYKKTGLDLDNLSFEELGKEWMDEYEERKFECGLHAGIEDVLKSIQGKGIGQSILSAYSQHTLEEMVYHFKLEKYFTHLVGLDHIYATSKVHLGKDLIKKLGNGKGEVLLIGDTAHDFEVANEIGADCILIADGHQSRKNLEVTGAKVFDRIGDLFF